jgi:molybdate transport system substrate-binding protein
MTKWRNMTASVRRCPLSASRALGNAEVAFLPLALVKQGEGQYIEVDEKLHQPIDQTRGVVKASAKQKHARQFINFVLSEKGQRILDQYGYRKPPAARP